MKTLVFGIIGAVASAAVWMVLKHQTTMVLPYMALAVGLVTGYAVHAAAAAKSGESFGRGALAAVLTLAACYGGEWAYVQYMEKVATENAGKPIDIAKAEKPAEEPAEEDPNAAEDEAPAEEAAEPMKVADRSSLASGVENVGKAPAPGGVMDLVWLCGSGILAYIVGKSSKGEVAQASEEAPPAEPEGGQESEQKEGEA